MTKIKKLTSILLAVIMVFSIFTIVPITASAATSGDFEYEIYDDYFGDIKITRYNGEATELEIPSQLDGYNVTNIGDGAFSWRYTLKSITIPDSVTLIGNEAFYNCTGLVNLKIGKNVSRIGNAAFCCCTSLASVTMPYDIMDIGQNAFLGCSSLESITIPDSVTDIGNNAFYECTNLTNITIGNGIKSIDRETFFRCESLKSITIPDSVKSIGDSAFESCTSLASVTIPDSVTSIGDYAFDYCTSLASVTIPDGVTSIGDCAFYDCVTLKSVTIPNSVTSIGKEAFGYIWDNDIRNYVKIDDFTINGYEGSAAETYANENGFAFLNLDTGTITSGDFEYTVLADGTAEITKYTGSAKELEIPSELDGCTVTSIGNDAFSWCNIASVTIPNSVTTIGEGAFSLTDLTSITIPDGVTSIGNQAFWGCDFASVTIPNSVTSIGDSAFGFCSHLESVTIGNSVASIGHTAFKGCTRLTEINVSDNNPNYSGIDGVIFNKDKTVLVLCPVGKTKVTIPNSVTSIGPCAFEECKSLTSVTIPDSVTSIGFEAFKECENLASVTIPDSVTSIGDSAFFSCNSLTSVTIPDGVTNINSSAFCHCTSLASVTIPDSAKSIGDSAFFNCQSLTSVTIPDSVTSIDWYAFSYCTSLASVAIGNSVTRIAYYAFYECTSLKSITLPVSVTTIDDYAFGYILDEEYQYYKIIDGFTINGYEGSEADSYASENGFAFVNLSKATIYFAAPKGNGKDVYTWKNVQLYYGESSKMDNNNFINMTATGKVATVTSVGTLAKVVPGDWEVFSVTLTAEQIAAIDTAKRAGFINADNHNFRTDCRYANKISGNESIAAYDGKMFVIDGCVAASSEANTYTGKWTYDTGHEAAKVATIYFAAPKGSKDIYTWKNVQLYYGESSRMNNNKFIDMTATGKVATVASVGKLAKVVPGDWEVFSVALTAKQVAAIDKASRVGFVNADNHNFSTDLRYANKISGNESIAAYDGKMFVIDGCVAASSEANSYTGKWTDDTGHDLASKGATIYFAAPQGSKDIYTWKNVQLYYGESSRMNNNKFIDMTATGKVETVANVGTLTKVVPGDWVVFSVTLTEDQVAAIDKASRAGFINADNHNFSTDLRYANKISGNESISAYDGKMFLINGCVSASSEANSYTGGWK